MATSQVSQAEAALDELVKQVQSEGAARVAVNPQEQVFLYGNLRNDSQGPKNLNRVIISSGQFIRILPELLNVGASGEFDQVAKLENGIKAAVVYADHIQRGWLLAWSNPKDIQQKKVYVELGPIEKYNNIDPDYIWSELDKSGDSASVIDPLTRAGLHARILPPLKSANYAASDGILVARFSG